MEITLPYPPSINHYYGRTKRGQVFIKPKGRKFRADSVAIILPMRLKVITGRVKCHILINCPDKRRRDVDNIAKPVLDAMQHAGAYKDDCQIDYLTIERGEVVKGGKIVVRITDLAGTEK